ncbi:golgin subfamily A member 6-like protein 1 [Diprion similis]|uniref:golgin subfamily A member 6-like protein 1 n=1 Tax=Diprion similis TaxID=362088 RepID=UPI001EF7679B|nr:golgin subfamily A member 6-like protein 1 [Diprion similis]
MKGSFDPSEVQRLEEDVRRWEKEERLRKIEEKHLAGLISYEESLLAKQQLADEAKAQGDRVRLEREKLNAKLEKYRAEEMEKLRRTVEKCHEAEQVAKHAYTSMVDEKRQKAAEVAEESRRIKICLIEQKEEELRRKLQMIQEIKRLQSLQGHRANKELDQAETGRLGLMCEMSLAELKERLYLAKDKWRDELISRREAVKERRRKQKDLVDCVQKMINEHRGSKSVFHSATQIVSRQQTPVVYDNSKILETPELEALRRKLDDRRIKRIHRMNTPSTNVIFKLDNLHHRKRRINSTKPILSTVLKNVHRSSRFFSITNIDIPRSSIMANKRCTTVLNVQAGVQQLYVVSNA